MLTVSKYQHWHIDKASQGEYIKYKNIIKRYVDYLLNQKLQEEH